MLNALRPRFRFSFQSLCKIFRPSHVQCSLTRGNALHSFMSVLLSYLMFEFVPILEATPTFFIPALRPPGGGLRGAFFALQDALLHFASIVPLAYVICQMKSAPKGG